MAALKNVNWAKTGPHSWFDNVQHKEEVEFNRTWCHIWETDGVDRLQKAVDFGRVLFTGDGWHPAFGGIVPGSGFAGGLVLNLEQATSGKTLPPLRFSGSIEARGSYNGFWVAGGKLNIWGANKSSDDRHIHAMIEATHYELPQLTYYGLGNESSLASESLFGLEKTTAGVNLEFPIPAGFSIAGGVGGLWAAPSGVHGSYPSIEQNFTPANTPALNMGAGYLTAGGGINWIYPVAPRMYGYSSSLATLFQVFHADAPYSFRRIKATWIHKYSPQAKVNLGTVTGTIRLVESYAPAGDSVPFYLQPTIGGTDIDNIDVVRSYRDYRFRAPNLLAFQAEYAHAIKGPIALLGFYDVGKVAMTRGDLDLSHLHHSFGAGVILQAGNLPVMKLYIAWGGHEGTHTTYTTNTNNFTLGDPTGVF